MKKQPLPFVPEGIMPAALLAFKEDYSIDEEDFRAHLSNLANTKGVTAICMNGHAGQIYTMSFEEQRWAIETALDEVGDKVPLLVGVYAESSLEAARIAKMAEEAGASGLLVFPPAFMYRGAALRPEMAMTHFKTIANATSLPIVLFQYKLGSNLTYPESTLVRLCEEIPSIVAIKDGIGDPVLHERQIRILHGLKRPVKVLTTHSAWLLASFVLGSDGLISGAGSTISDIQAAMFEAVKAGDLRRAQELSDRIYPITRVFYQPQPLLDMHNRMKYTIAYLGRVKHYVVRPPECPIPEDEKQRIREACAEAGLEKDGFKDLVY